MSICLIPLSPKLKFFQLSIGSWAETVNAEIASSVSTKRERWEIENTDFLLWVIGSFESGAKLVESLGEFAGDLGCVPAFDLTALEHVDEFTVFQYGDRRGRRSVTG